MCTIVCQENMNVVIVGQVTRSYLTSGGTAMRSNMPPSKSAPSPIIPVETKKCVRNYSYRFDVGIHEFVQYLLTLFNIIKFCFRI